MSKRILMVAYTQYVSDARPRREAESLVSRGDVVDFIALAEPGRPRTEIIEGVRILRLGQSRYRGANSLLYILNYIRFFLFAFLKVTTQYLKRPYDIVYVHTMPDFIAFTAFVPKFYGASVILDIHDTMPELFATKFNVTNEHWLIKLLTFQEIISARFADGVVVTHDLHREIFVRHGIPDEKIFTSINYADPRLFFPRPRQSEREYFTLIYHGTIVKRLGLDIALRAVAIARENVPNIRLNIIGDGELIPELVKLAEELRLNGAVYFSKCMLPLEQIPDWVEKADVGIVPNRIDEATSNMMPVKLLEYLAMEKPVIAARTRVVDYYFGGGIVKTFAAEDVKEFAECIISLYNNSAERSAIIEKTKEFNHSHNWELQKKSFFDLIDNIL